MTEKAPDLPLLKATVLEAGPSLPETSSSATEEDGARFQNAGGIKPPYDPKVLGRMAENSAILAPNIEAYKHNIEGTGFEIEPEIDLDTDGADEAVKAVIRAENMRAVHWRIAAVGAEMDLFEPTLAQVYERKERLRRLIATETLRLKTFFDYCCRKRSFTSLRLITRHDLEVSGNAYWECLRDQWGDLSEFVYVPSESMRLMPLDKKSIEIDVPVKVTQVSYETRTVSERFRRFVQIREGAKTYFKEFGDPRVISRKSGKPYADEQALHKAEGLSARPANEILHFKIHSPISAYGVPRWIAAQLEVLGTRAASYVNWLLFNNKSIPPMVIMVSGGRLSQDSVKEIKQHIEERVKGQDNYHKLLVIEAVPADQQPTGADLSKIKIQLVPLLNAQMRDGTHMQYTELNTKLTRQQFRNPPIMVGDSKDYNRATSDTAKEFAESQVYGLIRDEFDDMMNRIILADMGISAVRFSSNAITTKDSKALSEIISHWVDSGILTPEEARTFAPDVLGKVLKHITEEWATKPMPLTIGAMRSASPAPAKQGNGEQLELGIRVPPAAHDPGNPVPLRGKAAKKRAVQAMKEAQALLQQSKLDEGKETAPLDEDEVETIYVPASMMERWVQPNP